MEANKNSSISPLCLVAENYPYVTGFYLNDSDKETLVYELVEVSRTKKNDCLYDMKYITMICQSLIMDFNIDTAYKYFVDVSKALKFVELELVELNASYSVKNIKSYAQRMKEHIL